MINRETGDPVIVDDIPVPRGGILADEVGLGKTVQILSVIVGNPRPRTLIIVPKGIVSQWRAQAEMFMKNSKNIFIIEARKSLDFSRDGIYLVSQSKLNHKNAEIGSTEMHNVHWDRIVIDEAHSLRNKKSKFSISCGMLTSDIRWGVTATPVMNRMSDFVNIMNWVGVDKYLCQSRKDVISNMCVLRRTKDDIHANSDNQNTRMKKCIIEVKYIPFVSDTELSFYLKVFNAERNKVRDKSVKQSISDLLEHLLRVRQLCIHPQLYLDGMSKKTKSDFGKWEEACTTKTAELLSCINLQPAGDKTLIFCQFVQEMDIYNKFLNLNGYTTVRLDGTMTTKERDQAVHTFNEDANCVVFLIQINTGGQGINLQVANRVYIMSPNWNPAIEYQAIGRAYRTGQTKDVHVTKFCISSGNPTIPFVEENIMKLQERKKTIISDILNDIRIVNDGVIHNDLVLNKAEILKMFNIQNEAAT